jgi:hypothetical protein
MAGAGQAGEENNQALAKQTRDGLTRFQPIRIRAYEPRPFVLLYSPSQQYTRLSLYGSTPNGSCSRDVGVWPDGLCTAAVDGVNAVDALGNGANDGTSAENPPSGEEKLDLV